MRRIRIAVFDKNNSIIGIKADKTNASQHAVIIFLIFFRIKAFQNAQINLARVEIQNFRCTRRRKCDQVDNQSF